MARLTECPALAGLRELELMYEFDPDDPLGPVVRSPPFPSLRSLDLSGCAFEARGVRRLAVAPLLSTLHALDLSYCDVGTRALSDLLQAPHLTGLRRLLVRGCDVETADVRALVAYPWRALEWLDLSDNDLGPVAGELLGASAHAVRLRYLDVSKNLTFGDRGVKALARSPRFGSLRALRLYQCGLTPAGLAALAGAGWLANLTWLGAAANYIGVRGIKALAAAPLHGLGKLEMGKAALTVRDVRELVRCPWLAGLSHLELDNNNITDAGALALAEALDPGRIAYLYLAGNRIQEKGKRRLRRRFGERVQWRQPWEV